MRGNFNQDFIQVPVHIYGAYPEAKQTFQAIVDTGYAGYLTLPFVEAFPLGLILKGTQEYVLADGSRARHFICFGTVQFDDQEIFVPIDVQESGPILLGMSLLKKLEQNLLVDFKAEKFEFTPSTSAKKPVRKLPNVKIKI
jgi:predicted aspartyl protease